ncbi:hypothetical protein ACFQYP_26330 [Nonomuraea antimicrobica]
MSKTEPLSGPAKRSRAVAAVNGDFFDINNSGAAQGIGVQDGKLIQSPVSGHENAVAVTGDGVGRVLKMYFEGSATRPAARRSSSPSSTRSSSATASACSRRYGAPTTGPAPSRAPPPSPRPSWWTAWSPRYARPPAPAPSPQAPRSCWAATPGPPPCRR